MRFSEIINESPKKGTIDLSAVEVEVSSINGEELDVSVALSDDAAIFLLVTVDVDAKEVDAGFGYEYGSISGYHPETDVEGGFEIESYEINKDDYKDKDAFYMLKHAAKLLQVPGRQSKNPSVVLKYLEQAVGGQERFKSYLYNEIEKTEGETIINNHIEATRDDHPDY